MVNEEELYEWLENNLSISGYDLKTRSAYISKGAPVIGFKGWVNYNLSEEERSGYQKWVDVLAKFAAYSNVGGGRTAGFGCVSYRPRNDVQNTSASKRTFEGSSSVAGANQG